MFVAATRVRPAAIRAGSVTFGAASWRPGGHDPWALLAAAVVGRAVAGLRERHHAWDARDFLLTRLAEPDNVWGELLGELRPLPTHVQAVIQRQEVAGRATRWR